MRSAPGNQWWGYHFTCTSMRNVVLILWNLFSGLSGFCAGDLVGPLFPEPHFMLLLKHKFPIRMAPAPVLVNMTGTAGRVTFLSTAVLATRGITVSSKLESSFEESKEWWLDLQVKFILFLGRETWIIFGVGTLRACKFCFSLLRLKGMLLRCICFHFWSSTFLLNHPIPYNDLIEFLKSSSIWKWI